MRTTMVGRRRKILGFRWSKKAKITLEAISFWRNTSFSIFSNFVSNESLRVKFYQFFKIYKRFDKEREKTLIQQSVRKEKLRKVGLCFITGYFIKPFKMTKIIFLQQVFLLTFFYFASSFAAQFLLFDIRMTREISKGETGNSKLLGMANYNIYFKNNFNRLVTNVTQIDFIY